MKILITGICGFVGHVLAARIKSAKPAADIFGIDNLMRAGSEANRRLARDGIRVLRADIRCASDVDALGPADWVIDAAANPSASAGFDSRSSTRQLVEHNLFGTVGLLESWQMLNKGWDCIFGSRFMKGGGVIDYPWFKLQVNRLANTFLRFLFKLSYNDTTNAFKAYRRTVIDGCRPLISPHVNLTVEIPMKAIVRGYSWTVIPITWRNRRTGQAKLKIKEKGSRYLFICLYVWLEKYFSPGDYRKTPSVSLKTGREVEPV